MSWYLTIRSDFQYSQATPTASLVEFLAAIPELRQTGPTAFESVLAKSLSDNQRQELAVRALAGTVPVTELATQIQVSVVAQTVRANSVVENLNSRLRSYFALRRSVGPDDLERLPFFLIYRVLARSEQPERAGRVPPSC
ncbi:hypothetical protein [Fimbriiglobus ruber]|uniref:Uncharacterized protein n=1 Tax=Fimbriiglobus ruber TaxID=1908690 RepID=A0A225DP04_9BACT|nr:hypothetical protein [Fimbriiglobus ruber]OWK38085.1 hypothetical protein FRUB_07205 [Fimbriiglobus ruber]